MPAGQIYYNNIVLNGNTLHVHGSGHGTVKAHNGARLDGDINGDPMDIIVTGHVKVGARSLGGSVNVLSGATLDLGR